MSDSNERSTAIDPPSIRVEDWSDSQPIPLHYYSGLKELDFKETYAKIKKLQKHKGRGSIQTVHDNNSGQGKLTSCASVDND
jgi:hypothetical protein